MSTKNQISPKVKAGAAAGGVTSALAVVLAFLFDRNGVQVDETIIAAMVVLLVWFAQTAASYMASDHVRDLGAKVVDGLLEAIDRDDEVDVPDEDIDKAVEEADVDPIPEDARVTAVGSSRM